MSLDIEKIKTAALAATPIATDLCGNRYFCEPYSQAYLIAAQDRFTELANPSAVHELITRLEAAEHTEHCRSIEYGDLRDSYDHYKAKCLELQSQLSKGKHGRELELEQYVEKCTGKVAELQEQLDLQIPRGALMQQAAQIEMLCHALEDPSSSHYDRLEVARKARSDKSSGTLEQFAAKVRKQCSDKCDELANHEENAGEYRDGASWCSELIKSIKELP